MTLRLPILAVVLCPYFCWGQTTLTGCGGATATGRLNLQILESDPATGTVQVTGGDARGPSTPFTWSWGDGTLTQTFFPATHIYSSTNYNYALQVTAHENDGSSDCAQIAVTFQPGKHPGQAAVIPQIDTVSPAATVPGGSPLTLTIHGSNVLPASTVAFDGIPRAATFIDSATISLNLTASDQASAGYFALAVANPPPNGGAAQSYFAVAAPETPGVWKLLGPHHVNGRTGGLESGKLQAFAVASDHKTLFAGGGLGSGYQGPYTGSGVFKSVDAGAHWTSVNNGITDTMIDGLWIDPADANNVLAATENDGIFRTANGGASWTPVYGSGASDFIVANGKLLAATAAGIQQSSDLGVTWSPLQSTSSPVRVLASAGSAVIAGLQNGTLLLQASPGADFQTVSVNSGQSVWSVALDPASPAIAFAVLALGTGPHQLLGSVDGGHSWSPVVAPQEPQSVSIAADHTVYLGTGGSLLMSRDTGKTWQVASGASWDIRKVYIQPGPFSMVLGTDQGLQMSSDGLKTWSGLSGSVPSSIISGIAVRGATILAAAQDFSPIFTFDSGTNWNQPVWTGLHPPVGEDGTVLINPGNPSYCYIFTAAGFQYSTDGGRNWQTSKVSGAQGIAYQQPGNANIIAVDPNSSATVYAAAQDAVYVSHDSGATFTKTTWGINSPTAIAFSPADSRTIVVGTGSGLFRSADAGATWKQLTVPGNGYPVTLAFHPRDSNIVLAGLNNGPGAGAAF